MDAMKRSVCPFDCPDTCGLLCATQSGKVVRVTGDPEHPITGGNLCPKMMHYERSVHSPLRLTTPLLRTGEKGSGQFCPIAWNEAMQLIVSKWQTICAEWGSEAILPYSYAGTMGLVQRNCGHAFFHRLSASRLERTICSPAKSAGWQAVMGKTPGPDPRTAKDSDLIILWGINAAATNLHFLPILKQAKKQGARVILIDTYETPTASWAEQTISLKPGSDGALALAMMHVLVRKGLTKAQFLRSETSGFAELADQVLPNCTPAWAQKITGVAAAEIEALALAYGQARAPFIRLGSGLSRYGNGAMTVRTICVLPALVGAYGVKGGGLLASTNASSAFDLSQITREDLLKNPVRSVKMNHLGSALNSLDAPPIQSLFVYHSNPAAIAPDQNAVLKGLARKDLFTVVHERFLTDTARWADLVLPACSSLETADLYCSYGHYFVQRSFPVIAPVGESKSNWEMFSLLAGAMGFDDSYFKQDIETVIGQLISQLAFLNPQAQDDLRAGKAVELKLPTQRATVGTASGKVEIIRPEDAEPLPRYLPPHETVNDEEFWLVSAPSLYSLNSSFQEVEELRRKQQGMSLLMHPEDAKKKHFFNGMCVTARNEQGEVEFLLQISEKVPPGTVVTEGVWWSAWVSNKSTVNALTSQRLTDRGRGSTFYDTKVNIVVSPVQTLSP